MRRALPIALDTLFFLAIIVWLGGLIMFMANIQPEFRSAHDSQILYSSELQIGILRNFGRIIEMSGIIMVGLLFILRRRYQQQRNLFVIDGVRQLLTFLALMIAEYIRYILLPNLLSSVATQSKTVGADFTTYRYLGITQVALLIVILALTIILQSPYRIASGKQVSPPEKQVPPSETKVPQQSSSRTRPRRQAR